MIREQTVVYKKETEAMVMKMVGYESRIAELTNYVHTLQQKNLEEAAQIKLLDEDSVQCGGSRQKSKRTSKSP